MSSRIDLSNSNLSRLPDSVYSKDLLFLYIDCEPRFFSFLEIDLSCPSNSACVFNGPGCFNCLCLSDYFGFRCLSHGTFPTIIFVLSTLGVMIVICGLLLLYRLTGRQAAYQEVPSQEI
ncbi:unnamed protein product [Mesocestoides corti]|uniref:EGF-like domain-containing protein n=1 Tax=Mesocestoides corti TaxID=53468 RepID=A0A0R3UEX7_MESCO|nr:unnamed protein product [Mesocestoides corti]